MLKAILRTSFMCLLGVYSKHIIYSKLPILYTEKFKEFCGIGVFLLLSVLYRKFVIFYSGSPRKKKKDRSVLLGGRYCHKFVELVSFCVFMFLKKGINLKKYSLI